MNVNVLNKQRGKADAAPDGKRPGNRSRYGQTQQVPHQFLTQGEVNGTRSFIW
jgi:hypothetical protein